MLNVLHLYVSTFHNMCVMPIMAVFCSFLISYFPGMLLRYFLNDFEMVISASIRTGGVFFFVVVVIKTCFLLQRNSRNTGV